MASSRFGTSRHTSGVVLALVVLLVALGVGLLLGGRVGRLAGLPLSWTWLVPVALVVQVGGALLGLRLSLVPAFVLVGAFLLINRAVPGLPLVGVGLLVNSLVIVLNAAMPVSLAATAAAGVSTEDILTGADSRHVAADGTTHLRWLGDVVPVPLPVHPEVVSPGDILVAAGLAQLVVVGMLPVGSTAPAGGVRTLGAVVPRRNPMAKRGRKRRARKKSGANHGKRPNA